MTKKITISSGKRKHAIARIAMRDGEGIIRINKIPLQSYGANLYRLKIQEPLILAGELAKKVNADLTVMGGGMNSQAEAARVAIAKALVEHSKSSELKDTFLEYDRNMLIADVRYKEQHKPNRHGKARAKVQKSYR